MIEPATQNSLLGTLGIDWRLFLAQLVNFGIVVVVLWRWAYRPLLRMLDTRTKMIATSLEQVKEIDKRMKRVGAEEGSMIKAAHEKAQAILTAAEASAKVHLAEATEATKVHVDSMIVAGKNELAALKENLIVETKKDLADVVAIAIEKIVGESSTDKVHAELVKKAQKALNDA